MGLSPFEIELFMQTNCNLLIFEMVLFLYEAMHFEQAHMDRFEIELFIDHLLVMLKARMI